MSRRAALGLLAATPPAFAQITGNNSGPAANNVGGALREPLVPFRQFKRFGYKDQAGRLALKPIFDGAGSFFDLLGRPRQIAWVRVSGKFGYIDRQGRFVIQPTFDTIREFSEGMAAVQKKGLFGFITETGTIAIEPQFDEVEPFSNGTAAVRADGATSWIDRTGKRYAQRPTAPPPR